jgi:hypothetical protein
VEIKPRYEGSIKLFIGADNKSNRALSYRLDNGTINIKGENYVIEKII